jgi:hypothetical protein
MKLYNELEMGYGGDDVGLCKLLKVVGGEFIT